MPKARKLSNEQVEAVKRERFQRVATYRTNRLIHDFQVLGQCCANSSYIYTSDEADCIIREIERQTVLLKEKFAGVKPFTLRG